jgi:tripartite motif-containing protein 71
MSRYRPSFACSARRRLLLVPTLALTVLGLTAGTASAATFLKEWGGVQSPQGIAVTKDHVYVADHGKHQIQTFTNDGQFVRSWNSYGACSVAAATDHAPVRLVVGECSGTDQYGSGALIEYTADGRQLRYSASTPADGGRHAYGRIEGVAVNGHDIYAADFGGHFLGAIRKFHRDGDFFAEVDDDRWPRRFHAISAIAVNPRGSVFGVDTCNVLGYGQWSTCGSGPGQLSHPKGIAFDPQGNVYVADTGNNRIEEFTDRGTYLNHWTSPGPGGGNFNSPYDVGVDPQGNIYVADTGNRRIVKFAP